MISKTYLKLFWLAAVLIPLAWAAWWLLPEQARLGPLENIHGIPYPFEGDSVLITEKLAHADIYLMRSPILRTATLTVTLSPLDEQALAVGIRENSFWLSYPKHELYTAAKPDVGPPAASDNPLPVTVTIPLTDKLPDRDGSLDLMFFAAGLPGEPDEGADVRTRWLLHNVQITTYPTLPSRAELKDAARRLIKGEQVL